MHESKHSPPNLRNLVSLIPNEHGPIEGRHLISQNTIRLQLIEDVALHHFSAIEGANAMNDEHREIVLCVYASR